MKFIVYYVDYNPSNLHPQDAIKELGFKEIHGVPQSILGGWWFCVEDYEFDIKERAKEDKRYEFVSEMKPYNLEFWRDKCWKDCEYFQKSFDEKTQTRNDEYCCYCGSHCLKKNKSGFPDSALA